MGSLQERRQGELAALRSALPIGNGLLSYFGLQPFSRELPWYKRTRGGDDQLIQPANRLQPSVTAIPDYPIAAGSGVAAPVSNSANAKSAETLVVGKVGFGSCFADKLLSAVVAQKIEVGLDTVKLEP